MDHRLTARDRALIGRRFGHVTQSDFIADRYQSPALGILITFCSAIIMIAYIDLHIEGLGAILNVLTEHRLNVIDAEIVGFLVLSVAVFFGGIRGNAWQSVIKDVLMFGSIAALFFCFPVSFLWRPAGDAKGAALAMMVEALAAGATGANFAFNASSFLDEKGPAPATGQMLVALVPEAAGGSLEHMRTLFDSIAAKPGARLPGARRFAKRREAQQNGILVQEIWFSA